MEKKSIGRFIAALRKANGMTQKELAEQLNVSDKAVSRWERDESAPDLSLIPVIAEIFHVTSDEILRGERKSYQETASEVVNEKGKKQIAMLLNQSKVKFQMYSVIARGIAGIGVIAAMICNTGFSRAYIGFFVGCIFCLIGLVMISVCFIKTTASIHMEEAEQKDIIAVKNYVIRWFYGTVAVIAGFFAFLLPLIVIAYDGYVGVAIETWMLAGLLAAGVVAVIAGVLWWSVGVKKFATAEAQKEAAKNKLKYVKRTAIALVITVLVHMLTLTIIDTLHPFAQGITFYTYEEFFEFMERDVTYEGIPADEMMATEQIEIEGEVLFEENKETGYGEDVYFDENRNEITFEEYEKLYKTETLRDDKGNIVGTYINRNESVESIRYGHIAYEEGEDMPITVYTHAGMRQEAVVLDDLINPIFVILYISEILAGVFFCLKNKEKTTK